MKTQTDGLQWFSGMLPQDAEIDSVVLDDLPNRRQEAWRYANLNRLYKQVFKFDDISPSSIEPSGFDQWVYPQQESYRLMFVNGRFSPAESDVPNLEGCLLKAFSELDPDEREFFSRYTESRSEFNSDAFDQLNQAIHRDGYMLRLEPNCIVDRPIEVVYLNQASQQQALAPTRSLILLKHGADAKVVERFVGEDNASCFSSNVTCIELDDNARLSHFRSQQQADPTYHLDRLYLEQKQNSYFSGSLVATGGIWSRSESLVNLNGPGAECHLNGVYSLDNQQYNDVHLDVRHLQPHCSSSENFRGILAGKGRAVFDGRILVDKDAQKTNAQLSNKNLLLAEGAEIDTKPQLEIYADDVSCSHGTTVGRIDPNHLFYCQSRGIDSATALQMLSIGFAEETLDNIEDSRLKELAHAQISAALKSGETADE